MSLSIDTSKKLSVNPKPACPEFIEGPNGLTSFLILVNLKDVRGLLLQIISGILGLFLAIRFISGVEFEGKIQILLFAGFILGLLNFFLKPILKFITLPLWFLTFGLFSFVINMTMIWLVDIIFPELIIEGVFPLFLTTFWVLGISLLVSIFLPKFQRSS